MTALRDTLSNLTDIDGAAAEHVQKRLLNELSLPDGWSVRETDVEPSPDGTGDWFIVSFQHDSHIDHFASVFILGGSHSLQLYVDHEDHWTEPTTHAADIEEQLDTAADTT